jgi:hypothetical protein
MNSENITGQHINLIPFLGILIQNERKEDRNRKGDREEKGREGGREGRKIKETDREEEGLRWEKKKRNKI